MISNTSNKHICIGSGFVALDVIVESGSEAYPIAAGGSCGNVLSILSFLGWRTIPVARLGTDVAAEEIIRDFASIGVDIRWITQEPQVKTPIIVELLHKGRHRFSTNCPTCGSYLPRYMPVLVKNVQKILKELMAPNVYYFDRASPSAINLAYEARASGALVVFEPSSRKDERLFQRALQSCHILKYSNERIKEVVTDEVHFPWLVIETLGAEGLRYKRRKNSDVWSDWAELPSFQTHEVIDTTGSGDWCTAGLLSSLARLSGTVDGTIRDHDLRDSLNLGQALAAINCAYKGARGVMHAISADEVAELTHNMLANSYFRHEQSLRNAQPRILNLKSICSVCKQESESYLTAKAELV